MKQLLLVFAALVALPAQAGKLEATEERLLKDSIIDPDLTTEKIGGGVQPFQYFYAEQKGMVPSTAGGLAYFLQTDYEKQNARLKNKRILLLGVSQGVDKTVFTDPGHYQFYFDGDFLGRNIGFVSGVIRNGENIKALQKIPENSPVVLNCKGLDRYKNTVVTRDCRFLDLSKTQAQAFGYAVKSIDAGKRFASYQARMVVRDAVKLSASMSEEERDQCLKSKSVPCYKEFLTTDKIDAVMALLPSEDLLKRFKTLNIEN